MKRFFLFKSPLDFIRAYLTQTAPSENKIELRNGMTIYLSSHLRDAITVFVIFARKDYDNVPAGSVVVDILSAH